MELFLTDLLPESFQLYMGSRTGREFLTQILTNAIFLPLFHRISEPRMIYYIIVLLWETDEQKRLFESEQNSLSPASETDPDPHDEEPAQLTEDFGDQVVRDDHREPSFERIIYTATILSTDRTYNSMSGAAYTVYTIQVSLSCRQRSRVSFPLDSVPRNLRSFPMPSMSTPFDGVFENFLTYTNDYNRIRPLVDIATVLAIRSTMERRRASSLF